MAEKSEISLDAQIYLVRAKRLAKHVWAHFQEDRCLEEAASLSYTSLLSMVPLLAVAFGIISVFPVFEEWSGNLQDFIFQNFMPELGEQIVPYINTFLDSVTGLTLAGTLTLIVTALMLLIRIEVALNRIWRVDRNRALTNRIVMYWALLTLGPLLIAAAIALSAQKIFGASGFFGELTPGFHRVGMFFISWMVFALLFSLVPNRRVRFKDALIGAFLSAVLFEAAKAGFVGYVSNASYKVIYGALATVPLFLFWLYLVWIVILLGASLAASLTTFSDYSRDESKWPERWEFQLVYRLLGHLWSAQRSGLAVSRAGLLELEPGANELQVLKLLTRLREGKIVTVDEEGDWMLARDLGNLTLGGLYSRGEYYLPIAEIDELPEDSGWDKVYIASLSEIRRNGEANWEQPLGNMYETRQDEGKNNND